MGLWLDAENKVNQTFDEVLPHISNSSQSETMSSGKHNVTGIFILMKYTQLHHSPVSGQFFVFILISFAGSSIDFLKM